MFLVLKYIFGTSPGTLTWSRIFSVCSEISNAALVANDRGVSLNVPVACIDLPNRTLIDIQLMFLELYRMLLGDTPELSKDTPETSMNMFGNLVNDPCMFL